MATYEKALKGHKTAKEFSFVGTLREYLRQYYDKSRASDRKLLGRVSPIHDMPFDVWCNSLYTAEWSW